MKPSADHPWTKAELKKLHARYLAGEYASTLAKIRGRRSAWLLARFQAHGWPLREKKSPAQPKRFPTDVAEAMYADYQAGMSLADVERKHGRSRSCARSLFIGRGWAVKPPQKNAWRKHRADGTWEAMTPKTEAEIEALIQAATKVMIPPGLAIEWRKWSLERRGDFIRRVRARLKDPLDMPDLPFSANVKPFDYASEEAWGILRAVNGDRTSQRWIMHLKLVSQGVIYDGRLWFWVRQTACYMEGVQWRPDRPRRVLARVIWESVHGKLPKNSVVRLIDGNPNNLDPSNLTLAEKNEVCRENQAAALQRKSRERTAAILNHHQHTNDEHAELLQNLGRRAH